MRIIERIRTALTPKNDLGFPIQGAMYSELPPVGIRKDNGIYFGVNAGIAKTKRESGAPKSKKQLRQEKDARYFARLQEKRYEYQIGHVAEGTV